MYHWSLSFHLSFYSQQVKLNFCKLNKYSTYIIGLLEELKELMFTKHLKQYLTQSDCSIVKYRYGGTPLYIPQQSWI